MGLVNYKGRGISNYFSFVCLRFALLVFWCIARFGTILTMSFLYCQESCQNIGISETAETLFRTMTSQIDKPSNTIWKERNAVVSNHSVSPVKSVKRLKSPKKTQEGKKTTNDVKLEDVFLNSEYFKHRSGNISALSFCSGDNGENQWTINSKYPIGRRLGKITSFPDDIIKSDTAVLAEKEKNSTLWPENLKKNKYFAKDNSVESTEQFLEGILSGKGRFDQDLITLITDQMFLAERELQITRTHLIETISKLNERDLEILQLHEKIQNLQKNKKTEATKGANPGKDGKDAFTKTSEDYQRLIVASEKLKKQVKDMEEFLNDYGLVWVGDKESNQKPDFDKIIKSFQRLNAVASQPKIIQTTLGAKFELPREIPLVLYANGLLLRNNDFREYSKVSTSNFLHDVEDGYFPSELQTEFPEGVPFEVLDKRNEVYNPSCKTQIFQGQGNRLGSTFDGKPSPIVCLEPIKHRTNSALVHENVDKSPLKKLQKKRSRNVCLQFQEDKNSLAAAYLSAFSSKASMHMAEKEEGRNSKEHLLNVKVRFGKERTESFVLQVLENENMHGFQMTLQRKLCERFHDQCLVESEANNRSTDFEIHIYGRNPFRLSDHLNQYPKECGIVNNCVVNISEI